MHARASARTHTNHWLCNSFSHEFYSVLRAAYASCLWPAAIKKQMNWNHHSRWQTKTKNLSGLYACSLCTYLLVKHSKHSATVHPHPSVIPLYTAIIQAWNQSRETVDSRGEAPRTPHRAFGACTYLVRDRSRSTCSLKPPLVPQGPQSL